MWNSISRFYLNLPQFFPGVKKHHQKLEEERLRVAREEMEREEERQKVVKIAQDYFESELRLISEITINKKSVVPSGPSTFSNKDVTWEDLCKSLLSKIYVGGVISCFRRMLDIHHDEEGCFAVKTLIWCIAEMTLLEGRRINEQIEQKQKVVDDHRKAFSEAMDLIKSGTFSFDNSEKVEEGNFLMQKLSGDLLELLEKAHTLNGMSKYFDRVLVRLHDVKLKNKESILDCLTLSLPEGQTDVFIGSL